MILTMLLLARLYGLSERATEAYVNHNLSANWILGLAADEPAPDRYPLALFTRRIRRRGGERHLQELLEEITGQAADAGVPVRAIHEVDSERTTVEVNTAAAGQRQGKEG